MGRNLTCNVLLCEFEQPRVNNSSAGPIWPNWLKTGPGHMGPTYVVLNSNIR